MEDGILLLMSRYLVSAISDLRGEYAAWAQYPEANASEEWAEFGWLVDSIGCDFPLLVHDVADWLALDSIPNYDEVYEELPF